MWNLSNEKNSGLSKELVTDASGRSYSYVGTVEYMPPEIVVHTHGICGSLWHIIG